MLLKIIKEWRDSHFELCRVHESNHLVEPLIPMMISVRRKKILLFLIPFGIFFILSFAYLNLDKYVESEIIKFAEEKEVNLKSFELDHLNPDGILSVKSSDQKKYDGVWSNGSMLRAIGSIGIKTKPFIIYH